MKVQLYKMYSSTLIDNMFWKNFSSQLEVKRLSANSTLTVAQHLKQTDINFSVFGYLEDFHIILFCLHICLILNRYSL